MTSTTQTLREILLKGQATTQKEIIEALEALGIRCSQPKVSRLLHQIGAVKVVDTNGKTQYRLPHETGLIHELNASQERNIIAKWVLSLSSNDTMIVIHTTPGAAGMVARILDQQRMELNLLGTIAGDDTIFISPKITKEIKETKRLISQLLNL